MSEKNQYRIRIELLEGTLDMPILQTQQWGTTAPCSSPLGTAGSVALAMEDG